jgi:CheY-like chemotaxis protein
LLAEVDRLRAIVALSGEPQTLKATIRIPPSDLDGSDLPTVAVSASGGTSVAAPVARVVDPQIASFAAMTGLCGRILPIIETLRKEPGAKAGKEELATICSQLNERGATLGTHTAARLAGAIDSLVKDVCQRPVPLSARILDTVSQAADLLGRTLSADVLPRCADLPAPSVLVVDDDKDLLPAILASLEFARLSATGCGTAADAMASVQAKSCDLVLLDIGLPGTDGLDLCQQIRALPKYERTPIVFLTGHSDPQNRGQGALNGGNDFVAKPFNMFELTLKAHVWAVKNQLGLA